MKDFHAPLKDGYARTVSYLRVSVTDRCDLRCVYCMPERMQFLPRAEVLSFEELDRLCAAFIARGVRKIRLTGGEPLVRRDLPDFMAQLGRRLGAGGLDELTLTTNGVALVKNVGALVAAGVRRINVSLDTLDPDTFARIARRDRLPDVLAGIDAARAAGLKVKINTVALAGDNLAEIPDLIAWAHARNMDITLIEAMPMGDIDADRAAQFASLESVRRTLESFWTLTDTPERTGGPARYVQVAETGGRLGFITPLSHNFCESCNRVRLTCTGMLYTCLGREDGADLRAVLRSGADDQALDAAITAAIAAKPKGHDFQIARLSAPGLAATHVGDRRVMRTLLFFGRVGDVARERTQACEPPEDVRTVNDLVDWLAVQDAALGAALRAPGIRVVLDHSFARFADPIGPAREIAFMSPLSGG